MQNQDTNATFRLPATKPDDEREDTIVIDENEFPPISRDEDGPVLPWEQKKR